MSLPPNGSPVRRCRTDVARGPLRAGPFDSQLEHREVTPVVGVSLGQCLGGGGQCRRFQDGEQLVEDGVLQPDTTDALADVFTGIELFGTGTHIPWADALVPE